MSLPYARTFDEIYLYLDLRPCACGDTRFDDRVSSMARVDGVPVERIGGHCANCGRERSFTFQIPDEPPEISFDVRYGHGDEPSRLLDPGEWLGVSELYDLSAQTELEDLQPADNESVTRVYYQLVSALAALDEVLKFVPEGTDEVPEGAFRSQAGRLVYETSPERFVRGRLIEDRAELAERIAEFERRFGNEDGGNDDDGNEDGGLTVK